MSTTETAAHHGTTTHDPLPIALCEACERLLYITALVEDPHHQTHRHASPLTRTLRGALGTVQAQLRIVRRSLADPRAAQHTWAEIGVAVLGMQQVHAHLGYLGARWSLGTADLFVRKLVAEGAPVPVPVLCVSSQPGDDGIEVGARLRERFDAIGLPPLPEASETPVLAMPAMQLLDPLSWPALLPGLGATVVRRLLPERVSMEDPHERERATHRLAVTVAARLLGAPVYAAYATRAILAASAGAPADAADALLHALCARDGQASPATVAGRLHALLEAARSLGGWGRGYQREPFDAEDATDGGVEAIAALLPAPPLGEQRDLDTLFDYLCDGRPINAMPHRLPDDFARRLAGGADPERFYPVLDQANEQPASLATILAVGWRYKVERTYPLCDRLMRGDLPWDAAMETLSAHVLERNSLLQQSIEASYVQGVFAHWKDR